MPRRRLSKSKLYHIYSRGNNKAPIFKSPDDCSKIMHIINDSLVDYTYKVHSYCLMTNHYHFLIEDTNSEISKIMHLINLRYAKYFNYKESRTGKLFEREFQSKPILTDKYFLYLIQYIHNNWVKAGSITNKHNKNLCSYKAYLDGQSDYHNFTNEKCLNLLNNNLQEFIELHNRDTINFNPLIKGAENAFLITNRIKRYFHDDKAQKNLIAYYLKKYNSNSYPEIQSVINIPNINTLKSRIKRAIKSGDLLEKHKEIILRNAPYR